MIYKKNPETGEIREYANIDNIGVEASNWPDGTQEEIDCYELEKVRTEKSKELDAYYDSSELWAFTLKDGQGNSLTREQNWFLPRITKNIFLISDEGNKVLTTIQDPEAIRAELNNIGIVIFEKKSEILIQIKNAKTITEINKIDITQEFKGVNKEIVLTEIQSII